MNTVKLTMSVSLAKTILSSITLSTDEFDEIFVSAQDARTRGDQIVIANNLAAVIIPIIETTVFSTKTPFPTAVLVIIKSMSMLEIGNATRALSTISDLTSKGRRFDLDGIVIMSNRLFASKIMSIVPFRPNGSTSRFVSTLVKEEVPDPTFNPFVYPIYGEEQNAND